MPDQREQKMQLRAKATESKDNDSKDNEGKVIVWANHQGVEKDLILC